MSKKKNSNGNGASQQQLDELKKQVLSLQEELSGKDKRIEDLRYYQEFEAELQKERQDLSKAREAAELAVRENEAQIRKEYFDGEARRIADIEHQANANAANIQADAEQSAAQIVAAAQAESAQLRESADTEAAELHEDAELVLANAREQRDKLMQEAESEKSAALADALEKFENTCATRLNELERRESVLKESEAQAKKDRLKLEIERADFQFDRDELKLQSDSLRGRWLQCSPERLAIANARLEESQKLGTLQEESLAALRSETERLRKLIPVADGRPAEVILKDLEISHQRLRTLEDQLAAYPSTGELNNLRKDSELVATLRVEYHALSRKCMDLEQRSLQNEIGRREVEQLKVEADALRVLNDELRSELQTHKEALEQKTGERFPELSRIDRTHKATTTALAPFPNSANLLQRLARHVRQYAATRRPQLFYSEEAVRAFIAGLAGSRLSILQGLSGTGKTSLPRVFIESIGGEYATVPVQSSWRDRHELLGYNNDFNKRFSETEFTKAIYRSGFPDQQEKIWFVLLDEMNLARIEYYFADFLSVLEEPDASKWTVSLMDYNPFTRENEGPKHLLEGHKLKVNENLWFIGTANQDESTFEITDKVYDRAQVLDFRSRQTEFAPEEKPEPKYLSLTALQRAFDSAIGNSNYRLSSTEWDYIETVDQCLRERLDLSFGNRIKLQMDKFVPVFVACGGRKEEAVDLQIARKVLRKLVTRFDAGLPDALKELQNVLASRPAGWQELRHSLELIDRKVTRARGAAV